MSVRDGVDVILGVLSGAKLSKGERMHRQLACSLLGSGIGALVDAGLSDAEISAIADRLLKQIRDVMATGDPMAALVASMSEPTDPSKVD